MSMETVYIDYLDVELINDEAQPGEFEEVGLEDVEGEGYVAVSLGSTDRHGLLIYGDPQKIADRLIKIGESLKETTNGKN